MIWRLTLGSALALTSALANLALLGIAGWFLTGMALAGLAGASFNYFIPAALIRALAIGRAGGRYLERLVTHDATLTLVARLRPRLFLALAAQDPGREGPHGGDLAARLGGDLEALQRLFLYVAVPGLVAVLGGLAVIGVLAAYAPEAAVLCALGLLMAGGGGGAVLVALGRAPGRASVAVRLRLREAVADLALGADELWSFGALGRHLAGIDAHARALAGIQARFARRDALAAALLPTLALATVWGVLLSLPGGLPGPEKALVVFLALAAFDLLAPLPDAATRLEATLTTLGRLRALGRPGGAPLPSGIAPVLLPLGPGARVGLVGPSGAGKTTVARRLAGLGPDASAEARASLAPQTPMFVAASLRHNLLIAAPEADDTTLRAALETVCLGEWLAGLPEGLSTPIGEGGRAVSGGRRGACPWPAPCWAALRC
ncbi:ATP-binding cassette domain-containing protein [Pararhodospirillum photometricum]|uniref:ABC transporter, CydDC cysteine exporter (CydDC-E) family, permease/ATP-binding protein CydC n=1 Tax=Pararhodospirillum photometricum DSM 122 TaxID=1150469 RepID=H6SSK5_PARPM|nr:ATP-binding cassette domain-containing protein [Pararhodospirillum photometricum]CCG07884.1 ABC transporter, CydDC cysteine exporter (CydDC-E) family, permease/ATP-binding protein CydC [Pararhodospirillum photometricum DSM 122]